jgi:hypothetical protein
MRGVNLGGWFSQVDAIKEKDPDQFVDLPTHIVSFLGASDFERIKAWGFDHVRLPVDYFNVFDEHLCPSEPILSLLDSAIEALSRARLNVILDLHKCPGHDFLDGCSSAQDFFSSETRREESKRVWQHLAERYGNAPHVMFELLNEPVAEDPALWDVVKDELGADSALCTHRDSGGWLESMEQPERVRSLDAAARRQCRLQFPFLRAAAVHASTRPLVARRLFSRNSQLPW